MSVDPDIDGLDRALSAVEWSLHESRRVTIAADDFSIRSHEGAGLIYVAAGEARIETDPTSVTALRVTAGDLVFFPRRVWHRTTAAASTDLVSISFTPVAHPEPTLRALPDHLVVHGFRTREPAVAGLLDDMGCPAPTGPPRTRAGSSVICSRIANTILAVALRAWVELGCATRQWTDGLADEHIARVVEAIHADLGRAWTVEDLARIAMMSRSTFAERFRQVVGESPATYITGNRMESGMRMLGRERLTVAETARRLGYESEAGFSRAFRRHLGASPAQWRREAREASPVKR